MICFHRKFDGSDGSIQTKTSRCSCESYNSGNFTQCLNVAGIIIRMSATDYDSNDSDDDDDDDDDDAGDEFEEDNYIEVTVDDEQYESQEK